MQLAELEVVVARPPVYDLICERIGVPHPRVVYTYGNAIYNPSGQPLSHALRVHEHTHSMQQRFVGGPEAWWERYLQDPSWRYAQELEAFRAEFQAFRAEHRDRNLQARFLFQKAHDLASGLYGRLVSPGEAMAAIRS